MSNASRAKGLTGEREVRAVFEEQGFAVRGLEASGDYLVIGIGGLTLHVESKRQEVTRPWAWIAQAEVDAPAGTIPIVAFRRNRSPWYAILSLEMLAYLLSEMYAAGKQKDA